MIIAIISLIIIACPISLIIIGTMPNYLKVIITIIYAEAIILLIINIIKKIRERRTNKKC